MDGGAWWATAHEVAKSQAQLSDFTSLLHFTSTASCRQGSGAAEPDLPRSSTRGPGCTESVHTTSSDNVPRPPSSVHFLKPIILQ